MKWGKKNHLLFHMDFLLSTNFNGVTFIPLLFCVEACWWATIIPSSLGKFDVSVGDSFVLCQEDWCWYWCFCLPHCSAHLGLLLHVLCHTLVYLFSLQICFTIKSIKSVLTHWRVLFLNAVCVCCTGSGFPQTGLHSFNSLFYFFLMVLEFLKDPLSYCLMFSSHYTAFYVPTFEISVTIPCLCSSMLHHYTRPYIFVLRKMTCYSWL